MNILGARLILNMSTWILKKLKKVPAYEILSQKQPSWERTEGRPLMSEPGVRWGLKSQTLWTCMTWELLGSGKTWHWAKHNLSLDTHSRSTYWSDQEGSDMHFDLPSGKSPQENPKKMEHLLLDLEPCYKYCISVTAQR